MKLGIISDLHSNVRALDAVLRMLEDCGIDHIFVLGDMFGYYPWALRTWRRLQDLPWPATFIKGNHDEMLLKRSADPSWTIQATYAAAIVQNLEELRGTRAVEWLQTLSFDRSVELEGCKMRLVHGTPDDPENGRFYPDNPAAPAWFPKAGEWLCLGHTHYPLVRRSAAGGWIINPGSVGQPRDGDPRPAFAVVDLATGLPEIRRIEYDVASTMRTLEEMRWEPRSIRAMNKVRSGSVSASEWLCIRADADERMGVGHVMRCLALAQAWQDRGGRACLVSALKVGALVDRMELERIEVVPVCEAPGSDADAAFTAKVARERGAAWVVLDGYHFTAGYRRRVKEGGIKLTVLDDLAGQDLSQADVILNQNAYAMPDLYAGRASNGVLLLASRYALIRREFLSHKLVKRRDLGTCRHILVMLGGSDPDNVTLLVLQALDHFASARLAVHVIAGAANPHQESLRRSAEILRRIHDVDLSFNPPNVAGIMADADLAITAAGSSCWELAFLGVPMLVVITAPNQSLLARHLESNGLARVFGTLTKEGVHGFSEAFAAMVSGEELRAGYASRAALLVDGGGAGRVVDRLLEMNHSAPMKS